MIWILGSTAQGLVWGWLLGMHGRSGAKLVPGIVLQALLIGWLDNTWAVLTLGLGCVLGLWFNVVWIHALRARTKQA